MVLVGHCTLKDCDVAGIAATNMNTDRYRSVPAFLLDIRFPPSLIETPRSCAHRRCATSAKINPPITALIARAQRDRGVELKILEFLVRLNDCMSLALGELDCLHVKQPAM
jgi:hypothetical protein